MPDPGCEHLGAFRWRRDPSANADRVALLLDRAAEQLASGASRDLRSGRRKRLYRLALTGVEPDHILKLNEYGGTGFWRRLRRSKARREFERARAVAEAGVPTPLPLAAGERRRWGLLEACALLVPLLEDAQDLRALQEAGDLAGRERRMLASALGALTARLLEARVFQRDLQPNNVLVQRGNPPRLHAIDFERARIGRKITPEERTEMLGKLVRSLPQVSLTQRWRFLLALSGGDRAAARERWSEQVRHAPRLAARDWRRQRRNVARGGRRFRALRHAGWRGYQRADAPAQAPDWLAAGQAQGAHRVLRLRGARAPEDTLAAAAVLHDRGLSPQVSAVISDGRSTRLLLCDAASQRPLSDAPPENAGARLRVFLERLLVHGSLADQLPAEALAWQDPDGNPTLLDPSAVRLDGRGETAPARTAVRIVAQLLPGG